MNLRGKKVIALGESEAASGSALRKFAEAAGAEVIEEVTQCFGWGYMRAMDLKAQESVKAYAQAHGTDNLVVLIGAADAWTARLFCAAVTRGDPTYMGALTGVQLGLPCYHITEPEIKAQVDQALYNELFGKPAIFFDIDSIIEKVKSYRTPDME